ncbi:MAG: peptide chain release factor 1, partial [Chloroflexi bacterium]|nr:peptide chain release factor 1 [Chloroflexota bacterium]
MLSRPAIDKLQAIERRYDELTEAMSVPDVASNPQRLQEIGRERSGIEETVSAFRELNVVER